MDPLIELISIKQEGITISKEGQGNGKGENKIQFKKELSTAEIKKRSQQPSKKERKEKIQKPAEDQKGRFIAINKSQVIDGTEGEEKQTNKLPHAFYDEEYLLARYDSPVEETATLFQRDKKQIQSGEIERKQLIPSPASSPGKKEGLKKQEHSFSDFAEEIIDEQEERTIDYSHHLSLQKEPSSLQKNLSLVEESDFHKKPTPLSKPVDLTLNVDAVKRSGDQMELQRECCPIELVDHTTSFLPGQDHTLQEKGKGGHLSFSSQLHAVSPLFPFSDEKSVQIDREEVILSDQKREEELPVLESQMNDFLNLSSTFTLPNPSSPFLTEESSPFPMITTQQPLLEKSEKEGFALFNEEQKSSGTIRKDRAVPISTAIEDPSSFFVEKDTLSAEFNSLSSLNKSQSKDSLFFTKQKGREGEKKKFLSSPFSSAIEIDSILKEKALFPSFVSEQPIGDNVLESTLSQKQPEGYQEEDFLIKESGEQGQLLLDKSTLHATKKVVEQLQEKLDHLKENVGEQIRFSLRIAAKKGASHASLRLQPAFLGEVDIELHWDRSHLSVHFLVENQTTKEILQQHLSELKGHLEREGLESKEMTVRTQDQNQQRHSSSQKEQKATKEWVHSFRLLSLEKEEKESER